MAFLTLEDMYGTVEVLVFPKDYTKYRTICDVDARLLIKGRVTIEEERGAKLICQQMVSLDEIKKEVWIKFSDRDAFDKAEKDLTGIVSKYDGRDGVVAYCAKEKMIKRYPQSVETGICPELMEELNTRFGADSVGIVPTKYNWGRN